MSAKPWSEPRRPLDERLAAAEVAIANVDTAAGRIAIMRELVKGAMEEVALMVVAGISDDPLRQDMEDRDNLGFAELIRSLTDAPAGPRPMRALSNAEIDAILAPHAPTS